MDESDVLARWRERPGPGYPACGSGRPAAGHFDVPYAAAQPEQGKHRRPVTTGPTLRLAASGREESTPAIVRPMGARPSIAFVSREVFPFDDGGLGRYVSATAALLAGHADVTIFTRRAHASGARSQEAPSTVDLPAGVAFRFVDVPDDPRRAGYYSYEHAWSDAAFQALKDEYPGGGPDLIEFPDYHAEAAVTVQARLTGAASVRDSLCLVRAYTPVEVCDVLNGRLPDDADSRFRFMFERYAMQFADRYLWAGGDVYEAMARFYGGRLAPGVKVRHPVGWLHPEPHPRPSAARRSNDADRLELLFVGRLERRKGVYELVRAVTSLPPSLPIRLTLVGTDTETGPLGTSMEEVLRGSAAGDERIEFAGGRSATDVLQLVAEADCLVTPSLWECWPNTALEALRANTPLIATNVGGYCELVQESISGWTTRPSDEYRLATLLERLATDRTPVDSLSESGRPKALYRELTDEDQVVSAYESLVRDARAQSSGRPRSPALPLVSIVMPYFRMSAFVEEALQSISAQDYRPIETIIVSDGSFDGGDELLPDMADRYGARLVFRENAGLSEARNFGVSVARGAFVLPFDPDDMLEPSFVSTCMAALLSRPDHAYVTSWVRFVDEAGVPLTPEWQANYRPVGNFGPGLDTENVAGTCTAIIRRAALRSAHGYASNLTSFEDWQFYKDLSASGLVGHVVPEALFTYRVRQNSMTREDGVPRRRVIEDEMRALDRNREMMWAQVSD